MKFSKAEKLLKRRFILSAKVNQNFGGFKLKQIKVYVPRYAKIPSIDLITELPENVSEVSGLTKKFSKVIKFDNGTLDLTTLDYKLNLIETISTFISELKFDFRYHYPKIYYPIRKVLKRLF